VIAGSGCDELLKKPAPAAAAPPPVVEVIEVKGRDVPVYGEWVATLDGMVNATISAQVSGYLMKQNYAEGTLVKKGDVLFEIDPRPFEAVLDQAVGEVGRAEAMLGKAAIDVERYTPLAREKAISQQELDNAVQAKAASEAMVASAKAAVQQARLNLEFTKILSPIDGLAGQAKAQVGDLVGPSSGPLTAVSTVDPIKAYFLVSEQDYLNKITQSGSVQKERAEERQANLELILSNGEVYPQKGRFLFIDRQVDVRTGTLKIAAEFPNPSGVLRPGQFGRIRAVTDLLKDAVTVPQRSVTEMQGVMQVAVVGDGEKVEIRNVKTGPRVGSEWVILEGLEPGESVIAEGTQKVRPGVVVSPKAYADPGKKDAKKQVKKPAKQTGANGAGGESKDAGTAGER
jgi:membrane fusion protein (multidrug efflux system)